MKVFITAVILGFPVALIFAWAQSPNLDSRFSNHESQPFNASLVAPKSRDCGTKAGHSSFPIFSSTKMEAFALLRGIIN
jgi:hypothetical protein